MSLALRGVSNSLLVYLHTVEANPLCEEVLRAKFFTNYR